VGRHRFAVDPESFDAQGEFPTGRKRTDLDFVAIDGKNLANNRLLVPPQRADEWRQIHQHMIAFMNIHGFASWKQSADLC